MNRRIIFNAQFYWQLIKMKSKFFETTLINLRGLNNILLMFKRAPRYTFNFSMWNYLYNSSVLY